MLRWGEFQIRSRRIGRPSTDLFRSLSDNPGSTSIDLPRDLHRRVHEAAAQKGCWARKLILAGIERAVEEARVSRPSKRLSLDQPLIRRQGGASASPTKRHMNSLNFPDIDLWLAIAAPERLHAAIAKAWWEKETGSIAFCRLTQLGFLRLMTTAAVIDGKPLSMTEACRVLRPNE
jgi:hypothetical protein